MYIKDNLDRTKNIEDQLEGFALAVNKWNPSPEDYVYRYSECDEWQKGVLRGLAIAIDSVDNQLNDLPEMFFSENEPVTIKTLREEYQAMALSKLKESMIVQMGEILISFGENSFGEINCQ